MSSLNIDGRKMPYRNLGGTGLMVSALSFGTMTLNDNPGGEIEGKITRGEEAYDLLAAAYKGGVNFFDCAEGYGGAGASERVLGECIQKGMERGLWERMDLVISTKLHGGGRAKRDTINSIGLSRKHLYEGMVASLKRLQLDYVDLVFCHRPDPRTPIEETVRGMNNLIDRGLVFYWGTSEWSAQMIQEARDVANRLGLVPPFFDQTQYNMLHRERIEVEYGPLYPQLGLTIWSPLAGGRLTDKTNRAPTKSRAGDTVNPVVEKLQGVAKQLHCNVAQLALAWSIANTNVSTAIFGSSSLAQLEDNFGALEVLPKLTAEVLQEIEGILENKPSGGPDPNFRTTASRL